MWKANQPVSLPVPFAFCQMQASQMDKQRSVGTSGKALAGGGGGRGNMIVDVQGPVSNSSGKQGWEVFSVSFFFLRSPLFIFFVRSQKERFIFSRHDLEGFLVGARPCSIS